MTATITSFDRTDEGYPRVYAEVAPTTEPFEALDLRFEAIGSEYPESETMFGIYDGGSRAYTLRHHWGAVWFVDEMLSSMGYVLTVRHGPKSESSRLIGLGEREMKRLANVRYHLAEAA